MREFFEGNPLEDFLQATEETTGPGSGPEQVAVAFICKRLKLNYKKLSEGRKEVAEKDCTEVGVAEKSKPTAGKKARERQIGNLQ